MVGHRVLARQMRMRVIGLRRRVRRTGSSSPALRSFPVARRSDTAGWAHALHVGHERYRSLHPIANDPVTAVCVSQRPEFVDNVIANFERQRDVEATFVFVANSLDFAQSDLDAIARVEGVKVLQSAPASLGEALNRGIDATTAPFIAKLDDDDEYGAAYLADSLRTFAYSGAALVGKHSYYAKLIGDEDETRHVLRFPGHEFTYSATLAGGTLVFDRRRLGDAAFEDLSLGEDRAFIEQCLRLGESTFATDRFNFVQLRGHHNTWQPGDTAFLDRAVAVDPTQPDHRVHR